MPDPIRKSTGPESRSLAKDPKKELRLLKGLTLPHARVKPKRGDKEVLADMGLLALLPDAIEAKAARPKPRPAPRSGKRPPAHAAWIEAIKRGGAKRLERIRAQPHKRTRAHILRALEPGQAYVVNDVIRALQGVLGGDAIKAHLRCRMIEQGLIERVAAPPGTPHRAPLMHGSKHKDPVRWFYRLTQAGIDERQAVLEHDAAAQ